HLAAFRLFIHQQLRPGLAEPAGHVPCHHLRPQQYQVRRAAAPNRRRPTAAWAVRHQLAAGCWRGRAEDVVIQPGSFDGKVLLTETHAGPSRQTAARRAARVHAALLKEYGQPVWRNPLPALDELVSTILSQNTNDINRDRAFQALRDRFPTWEAV